MNKNINILEYNDNLDKDNIVICYRGPFLNRILALFGEKINLLINKDPMINKKVFSIFLELAQNVSYYSEERDYVNQEEKSYGKGTFLISETATHYTLACANLIKKSWEQDVIEKCELINSLDTEGLRQLKRDLRNQPRREGHVGGNIGLVDIALKSGSPLQVEITSVNENQSYFIISIDVQKSV